MTVVTSPHHTTDLGGVKSAVRRSPNRRRLRDLLIIIPTFVLLAVTIFPVVWMIFTSLRPADALAGAVPWNQFFSGLGFASYERLFNGTSFARYILNSLMISCISTLFTVILANIAAFGLSRFRFRFRRAMIFLIISTQLLPFVVLVTPVYTLFSAIGLVNSYAGIIIVYTAMTLPLAVFLMLGYFDTIPTVLDEAARMDGCSTLGVIFRIIMPVSLPGIVTVTVTAFIATWEEFLFASVLLTSEQLKTVQVGLAGFFGEYSADWGVIMAAATVAAVPTIVLFSVVQKRLVAGMAAGSVKE
ncbi:carbohydrate ABC transporter permease [Glaciihabitans sp. UYNi722]|uniref:carbohydrate ABC transporter permease n=1 Tax=Glaciihabitans sp. UYNi722 TaxID=3156344 RepID=UPI0033975D16